MTKSIEQVKARLRKEDEEKERAFQKRMEEVREGQAAWRAEQEAEERPEQNRRQKLIDDARQKREREMRDSALASWKANGGTEEEFTEEWPSLRTEMLRRRTLEGEEQARTAQRRATIRRF